MLGIYTEIYLMLNSNAVLLKVFFFFFQKHEGSVTRKKKVWG